MDKCGVTIASWVTIGIVMVLLIVFTVMINVNSGLRGAEAGNTTISTTGTSDGDPTFTTTSPKTPMPRGVACKSKQCCYRVSVRGQDANTLAQAGGNVYMWASSLTRIDGSIVPANQRGVFGSGRETANITACVTGRNKDILTINGRINRLSIVPDKLEKAIDRLNIK